MRDASDAGRHGSGPDEVRLAERPVERPLPPGARRWPRSRLLSGLVVALAAAALVLPAGGLAASPAPSGEATSSAAPVASAAVEPGVPAYPTFLPDATVPPLVTPPPIQRPDAEKPLELADGYALGWPDAPVTVEVWEDFQCPYCQRFSLLIEPAIIATYVVPGIVRYVYRDLPFIGDESRWASVAARLAVDQGAFWPYHDYLYANLLGENVGSFNLARLQAIAAEVGLDPVRFAEGMQLENARRLFAEIEAGSSALAGELGIRATPTVVVNGVPLDSPDWESIQAAVDAALGGPASPSPGASTSAPASGPASPMP